jgi:hypothetical protein
MKKSQFIWWLKGYLENHETYMGAKEIELIKSKLDQIDQVDKEVETTTDKQYLTYLPGTSGTVTIPCGTGSNTLTVNTTLTSKTNNKQLLND